MAKEKKKNTDKKAKAGVRAAPAPETRARETDRDTEKPPESAEDFEHTLRRLIAAKNRS